MDCEEYKMLKAINVVDTTLATILVLILILGNVISRPILIIIGSIVCFLLLYSLVYQQKIDENLFPNIFQKEAGYEQVIGSIDFFSGLLRRKGQAQPIELRRFIFAAAYEHNKTCKEPVC